MGMYQKKPVVVEARHFVGSDAELHAIYQWIEENTQGSFDVNDPYEPVPENGVSIDAGTGFMVIATLEGLVQVNPGDYVIRGVQGEFYPCKPDIFEATYDVVEDAYSHECGAHCLHSSDCGLHNNPAVVDNPGMPVVCTCRVSTRL